MRQNHPEIFRLYPNVATRNPDRKYINNLLHWDKKIPKDKYEILEQLRIQTYEIYQSLEPLIDLGISFNLWITGGSVRDLLLGNVEKIKDLDIMLSFNENSHPHYCKPKDFIKKTGFNFETKKLKSILYRESESEPFANWKNINKKSRDYVKQRIFDKEKNIAIFDMFASSLGQRFELTDVYFPKNKTLEDTESYLDFRLEGVIKINKDNWKWPVDILVTTYGIDDFLSSFDLGICKVGIELVKSLDIKQQRVIFPQSPEELLKRIRFDYSFIEDSRNKELVIYVSSGMVIGQMNHSCEVHTPNVKNKYDWPFYINYNGIKYHENFDWDVHLAKIEKLAEKEDKSNRRIKKTDQMFEYIRSYFLAKKFNSILPTKEEIIVKKNLKKI